MEHSQTSRSADRREKLGHLCVVIAAKATHGSHHLPWVSFLKNTRHTPLPLRPTLKTK